MPRTATSVGARQLRLRAELDRWWRAAITAPPADLSAARELLREARDRYTRAFELGTLASMLAQGLYDQVVALAQAAARPGLQHQLVTGYSGMLETGLVGDLWSLAHGELDLASFLLRHGFHGPDEGQIASRVWREDPAPLLSLAARYAGLPPETRPALAEARQAAKRREAEAELYAALGPVRAGARLVLRFARSLIPQREIGKANYTQALDGARLAARVIGRELAAAGRLEDPDAVFGLTYDELLADPLPSDSAALAAERAALRADYLSTELPDKWTGPPARVAAMSPNGAGRPETVIHGEAVGGGSVTGRARVVLDVADERLEPGEILICRATDPGWTSLFHLAGGVAVDMGGTMSHAAIVARELGIPCLTCTVDGTRRVHTGDLIRLDGDGGQIEIIERGVAA
jgi:pyruvate,water dikinase